MGRLEIALQNLGFSEGRDWFNLQDGSMLISTGAKTKLAEFLKEKAATRDYQAIYKLITRK